MGIRFECPNGHRLHVKAFLAGRRGICPDCGARFEIPQENVARVAESPVASSATAATATGNQDPPERRANQAVAPRVNWDEAQEGNWFVCTATGDQYGPATTAVLRDWIQQGRIAQETLLWKEGWPNWVDAGSVLPEFASTPSPGRSPSAVGAATQANLTSRRARRHRRMLRTTAALASVMLLLLVVLIFVVVR